MLRVADIKLSLFMTSLLIFTGCTNFMTEDQILQDGVIRDMVTGKAIPGATIVMLQDYYNIGEYKKFSQARGKICSTLNGKEIGRTASNAKGYYHIMFDKPKYQLGTDRTYDVWYIIVTAPGYSTFCEDIYSDDPHTKVTLRDFKGRMRELNVIEMTAAQKTVNN